MSNLSALISNFQNQNIRTTEDGRFSIYDVLVAFSDKTQNINPQQIYKSITNRYPEFVCDKFKFPGRGQRETPVATKDVCEKILMICKKHPSGITSDKFFPRTETQVVRVLVKAFSDCDPRSQFHCSGYHVDLYLASPRIAIECDENGHRNYSQEEWHREQFLKSKLACSFVRFDPYDPDFNIGNIIKEIRDLI